jgi:hypothetical protein
MRVVSQLRNAVPVAVLRSPLHRLLSRNVLLLSFSGRVSGRRYTVPVVYSQLGEQLIVTTDSRWWTNLRDGTAVTVRLGRKRFSATASVDRSPPDVEAALRVLCAEHPSYHRFAEVRRGADGTLDFEEAAPRRVLVRIDTVASGATDGQPARMDKA